MKILSPTVLVSALAVAAYTPFASAGDNLPTIADFVGDSNSFDTLSAALEATGLDEPLDKKSGEFTVFAPNDSAFGDLPNGLVKCLLKDTDVLAKILKYHVVAGKEVNSWDLEDGQKIKTLLGKTVKVSKDNKKIKINDSKVITPDVEFKNGIVHVIDAVLVPPGLDVAGFLKDCKGSSSGGNNKDTDDKDKCHYKGKSAKHGKWLTGPTHTCKCNDGHWEKCYRNKHLRQ